MYLIGAPHPHKADAQRLLEKLVSERQRLVTDAEVLQEILHRYVAIGRRDAIQPAFEALLGIVVACCRLSRQPQYAPRRLYWAIPGCQRGTQCILPLWSNTKSNES